MSQPTSSIPSDTTGSLVADHDADQLYTPTSIDDTHTFQFLRKINKTYGTSFETYSDLYEWSINDIDLFWSSVWDDTGVIGNKGKHVVDKSAKPADNPVWFSDSKLNWAENMLWCRSPDKIALIEATEPTPSNPHPELKRISYADLYASVSWVVSALIDYGLKPGDRVASYTSNCIENVIACLAATAIGCIWVGAAADFGPQGVLERFEQVQPKLVFAIESVVYNAKTHNHLPKLRELLSGLREHTNYTPGVIVIPTSNEKSNWSQEWKSWDSFVQRGKQSKLGLTNSGEIIWHRTSFDWPLWILFSSGTTGRPKPIVHRAGGMLLQSKKEFAICADLKPEDVFFCYTTTGWMMWNFLVNGLGIGCTLVLYDGSPLKDPAFLWNLADKVGITIFGTSAKYLDMLSRVYRPREHHSLKTLKHIWSTASPLAPSLFDFVYQHIHPKVILASITGGTDICSLFAGMCTALPVYRGEIQCRMLGMAVAAYTPTGTPSEPDENGELVCLKPFVCQPVGFWPLPGFGDKEAVETAAARYQQAYFSEYPGIWYHGDHVILTRSRSGNAGGLIMLGRSDGVLNPAGIRFGSAELYDVIDTVFAANNPLGPAYTIVDCLAVGQTIASGTDERVVLFVKLLDGYDLSEGLQTKIRAEIRTRRSPRHVPARIEQVDDIPYTLNNKKIEVLVRKIINGTITKSGVNLATLRNPECLGVYEELGKQLRNEVESS